MCQEGPLLHVKGLVVTELFQQLKREISMVISDLQAKEEERGGSLLGFQVALLLGLGQGNPTSYCGWLM